MAAGLDGHKIIMIQLETGMFIPRALVIGIFCWAKSAPDKYQEPLRALHVYYDAEVHVVPDCR